MSQHTFDCTKHTLKCQHIRGYRNSTANTQDDTLYLEVKQYTPKSKPAPSSTAVTIIGAHACGYPKELYEPLWDDLHDALRASGANWRIKSIWIADMATHAASATLNEGKLGNDPSWDDHARDLLQMVNHFRDDISQPIIGIGHSMGATQLTRLALLHPRLLTSIVSIEAIIARAHVTMNFAALYPMTFKKDVWKTREAAIAEARLSPPFRTWDQRVFEAWTEHGYRELPTLLHPAGSGVTLVTTKHHDVTAFARAAFPAQGTDMSTFQPTSHTHPDLMGMVEPMATDILYRPEAVLTFEQLPFLRPLCLYVWAEKTPFGSNKGDARDEKMLSTGTSLGGSGGMRNRAVAGIEILGSGHFVVFERPTEVARHICSWVNERVIAWWHEDIQQAVNWTDLTISERAMVRPEWASRVERRFGKKTNIKVNSRL